MVAVSALARTWLAPLLSSLLQVSAPFRVSSFQIALSVAYPPINTLVKKKVACQGCFPKQHGAFYALDQRAC
jgi:hypothetical protein